MIWILVLAQVPRSRLDDEAVEEVEPTSPSNHREFDYCHSSIDILVTSKLEQL